MSKKYFVTGLVATGAFIVAGMNIFSVIEFLLLVTPESPTGQELWAVLFLVSFGGAALFLFVVNFWLSVARRAIHVCQEMKGGK